MSRISSHGPYENHHAPTQSPDRNEPIFPIIDPVVPSGEMPTGKHQHRLFEVQIPIFQRFQMFDGIVGDLHVLNCSYRNTECQIEMCLEQTSQNPHLPRSLFRSHSLPLQYGS